MQYLKRAAPLLLGLALLLCASLPAKAIEAETLVPGGNTVGIDLKTDGVVVVGLCDVDTPDGPSRPAETAGLRTGDVIRRVEGRETDTAAAFLTVMRGADGGQMELSVLREDRELLLRATPVRNREGVYQLGLWLRDGVSGIGTVTFYDPETGVFGALGHGVNDVESGELVPFDSGSVTGAAVIDVLPGKAGSPGELCGQFDREDIRGSLEKNTAQGIFGISAEGFGSGPVPIAREDEVHLGPAVIRSNIRGTEVKEYAVEISRIYRGAADNRFLLLTVTDPELLRVTGGIVQGMSGSPILQDGKLVGAVTHVLLSDPKRGYGISIEKMLKAA